MGKAIVGGAIGAAVGAAIWLGVENSMSRNLPWLALLVGLLAGLGVRFCCGKDQRSFITGTMAAVMALLGVVLGPMANQFWLQYNFDRQAKPLVSEEASLDSEISDEVAEETAADEAVEGEEDEAQADDAGEGNEDEASVVTPEGDSASTRSIIAAARPFLAQVAADDAPSKSAIREFFETNRDLIIYAASAILAYILASGSSKKQAAVEPVPDAGGGEQPA